jgi:hypothetical protein
MIMKKLCNFYSIRPSSHQQQSEEMTQYSASLSPIERLRYLKLLNLVAYGAKAQEPSSWASPIKAAEDTAWTKELAGLNQNKDEL